MSDPKTYTQPEHGWVCYHCGERFTNPYRAKQHFGARPSDKLACKVGGEGELGWLQELRKAQEGRKFHQGIERGLL